MATTAARRVSRNDGYGRFTRFYETPDGGRYPSVTAILGAINKPALVNWAAKTEREMVIRAAADLWEDVPTAPKMTRMAYIATLDGRIGKEKAHTKALTAAADIGSQAHAMAEWTLRRELKQEAGPEPKLSDKALWAFMAWEDWRKQANLVPLAIEQMVWSNAHGYAGTLDLYAELDIPGGKRGRCLIDFKTGKAIYKEASLQISAYAEALIEMGHAERPVHGMVVRLPKVESDPNFETKFVPQEEITSHLKTFVHVLELWRWMDEANG
jgi:hypothetical protein